MDEERRRIDELLNRADAFLASARYSNSNLEAAGHPTSVLHNGHGPSRESPQAGSARGSPVSEGQIASRRPTSVKEESGESASRRSQGYDISSSSSEKDELESPPPTYHQPAGLPILAASDAASSSRRNSFEQRMARLPVMAAVPLKRSSPPTNGASLVESRPLEIGRASCRERV